MRHRSHLSDEERSRLSRLRQLLDGEGFLRANLVEMKRRCGKASCRCAKEDEARHVSLYLSQSYQGRQRMLYISKALEGRVRAWVDRYHQARQLLDEVAQMYWDRLRQEKE